MGQALGRLQALRAARRDEHRDASIHSRRSVHPEAGGGSGSDAASQDLDVLDRVVSDEALEEGPHAALQAARECLESGELAGPEAAALAKAAAARQPSKHSPGKGGAQLTSKALEQAAAAAARLDGAAASGGQRRLHRRAGAHLAVYFRRMRGGIDRPGKIPPLLDMALGWAGAFASILAIAALQQWAGRETQFQWLVASFGASAVLVFGAPEGKLSQPRNLIGGHLVSALVGCTVRVVLRRVLWLSAALGMSLALLAMQLTRTLHPPGGATALIAASANPMPRGAGFSIVPVVLTDALLMLVVGLAVNNARRGGRYPTFWF